jgi:hypothetical protein
VSKQNRLNDAPILDQIDGQYEHFLLMILKKYVPAGATITHADIEEHARENDLGNGWALFSHGHRDSIEFKAIRRSEVARIKAHEDRTNKGHG